jgi:hypothetical protein
MSLSIKFQHVKIIAYQINKRVKRTTNSKSFPVACPPFHMGRKIRIIKQLEDILQSRIKTWKTKACMVKNRLNFNRAKE